MGALDINNLPDSEADISFDDIEEKYKISREDGFDTTVVIDNLPEVDQSKRDKLKNALRKIFKTAGIELDPEALYMPEHEVNGKTVTKGFAFVEFGSLEEASRAVKDINNYRMDKSHVLRVNRLTDVEKFTNVEDEYTEPPVENFVEQEHLKSWLTDRTTRDQLVMYGDEEVSVCWNRKSEAPDPTVQRKRWTETYVSWSPLGTYLTTIHKPGVAFWGGPSWKKVKAFPHRHVELIDFSPCENYLVTFSNRPISAEDIGPDSSFGPEDEGHEIVIWDIRSGNLLRSFPYLASPSDDPNVKRKMSWPAFKWSPSDRYFARVTPGQQISVYEAPGMGLLDKKSLKIEGVVDFEWQPSDSADNDKTSKKDQKELLAYWTPEISNQPARVIVLSVPDRAIVRSKNLFNVNDCKLHWQSEGNFLCIKVDRHTKTKKSSFTSLEVFRVREKDIPVEVLELKENVLGFQWEPKGSRFVIISTTEGSAPAQTGAPAPAKTSVSFYDVQKFKVGSSVELLKTMEKKSCNRIIWSPKGRHIVLATVGSSTAFDIEFWDLDYEADKGEDGILLMSTQEHYGVTDLEWDPTGRYLITSSSCWRHTIENGYVIWDFKGQELYKTLVEKFKQLVWRPRPKPLLAKDEMKKIRKNLKDYAKEFDAEDAKLSSAASAEVVAHRKRLLEEWTQWRRRVEEDLERERNERRGESPDEDGDTVVDDEGDDDDEVVEEWIEEVIEEYEEEVN